MSNAPEIKSDFIKKAEAVVLENLSNEDLGVSELAEKMNMSRSTLLRKIKKETQLSASQFIRRVRITKAFELLRKNTMTVSEVSYNVGFGNTSYFIKCFREQYGYSPGEVGKGKLINEPVETRTNVLKRYRWAVIGTLFFIIVASSFFLIKTEQTTKLELEKSIAVLPFKNESSDSLNLYFVNGLMETTLNNLQKIGDMRVISRTSVEKYRDTQKGIPEIAEELDVNYLVEGSGQRVGNQVLLHIQLIEASDDRPIWVEQYSREVADVFAIQNEVAKKIAAAIKAVVTPAEMQQIEKIPTDNLVAYDYYLQALAPFYNQTKEGAEQAIPLFKKAIENDEQFALAYANIAISYYYLDSSQKQKRYTEDINNFADKALLYDSKSAESLIAKALYYLQIEEYKLALPHLEKALEYNPNSSAVVQMLGDLYARVIPNTAKYLEYALKGIQLDIAANDSITQSYIYLHLSNALVQNGFVDDATTYINKSLAYNPNNYYSPLLKTFILFAQNGNIEEMKSGLKTEWQKDTTRLDILQEVAKVFYFQQEYDSAYYYYKKFVDAREINGLDIYPQENAKIAAVYHKMGLETKASELFDAYIDYCDKEQSIYKSASLAVKYAYQGKNKEAIEQLKVFAMQDNIQYWIVLFQDKEPIFKPLKNHPEYKAIMQKIENRFWDNHNQLKQVLKDKKLI